MSLRTPHLLEPSLSLPPESNLLLLTGVLGASTNWLVLRHLHSLLKPSTSTPLPSPGIGKNGETPEGNGGDTAVLLVSFLRDRAFWKENLARLGVDLDAAARRGRFGYVDGLGGLFGGGLSQQQEQQQQLTATGTGTAQKRQVGWQRTLTSAVPGEIGRVVLEGVGVLGKRAASVASGGNEDGEGRKVVLVIDGLDFVLAALDPYPSVGSGNSKGEAGTAEAVKTMVMELREKTHAVIVTLAGDDPLIREQETTLEKQHAWFALSLAHEADTVLSLRLLDTGAAKDVSGVIRITHTGASAEDHEYLYHVGGDGGVRVFERGQ
ncbi:hypothetical protein B0J18DRAFT_407439 [Chaetomium sp. MPI-SDFR-AT-0129]|nr:hypothetical protein B0J18DRAFT_407439 [Chaetomium sp. MPI-SDFR-AT-0129]